ncbi:MAG: GNAT family N-acetyltransferase [Anaerolineales bacterium]|jgi:ribosomal protein S18 acetylase RimI-like enzyme
MTTEISLEDVKQRLEQDRHWCAYALADLYPPYAPHAHWHIHEDAVLLIYRGLNPPILFAYGNPTQAVRLFGRLSPGRYQYGLLASHLAIIEDRLKRENEAIMWRMALKRDHFPHKQVDEDVVPLGISDLQELMDLFDEHPDRPDSFDEGQLANGFFFGIREQDQLCAIAGTHVVSPQAGVAALGNIFTHPTWRSRGYSKRVTSALVSALLKQDLPTIVLNVAQDNHVAIGIYRHLGFWPICGYHEGVGNLE